MTCLLMTVESTMQIPARHWQGSMQIAVYEYQKESFLSYPIGRFTVIISDI